MATLWTVSGDPILIDDDDLPKVASHRFYTLRSGKNTYAIARPGGVTKYLHRLIRDDVPHGVRIDHVNGDGMDNRRANLRPATAAQNGQNQHNTRGGYSQYKGVCWNKNRNKWCAYITVDKKRKHLGVYVDEVAAARAYDVAAADLFGEFAQINFPTEPVARPAEALPNNSTPRWAGVSPYLGVAWQKNTKKWTARFTHKKQTSHLGSFATQEEAARAYDAAAHAALGAKARLNFPQREVDEADIA